jgi:hypothetical protein
MREAKVLYNLRSSMETPPGYAQYPRYKPDDRQYHGPPAVRLDAIGEAWSLVRKDLPTWIVAGLLLLVLAYAVQVPGQIYQFAAEMNHPSRGDMQPDVLVVSLLSAIASNIVQMLLIAGFFRVAIMRFRGESSSLSDMFNLNGMGGQVLAFAAIVFGAGALLVGVPFTLATLNYLNPESMRSLEPSAVLLMLLVGVVILLAVMAVYSALILTPAVIVDQRLPAIEAMKVTWSAVRPHLAQMVGVYLAASLVAFLGLLACCVGFLFTFPVLQMTLAVIYRDLFIPPVPHPMSVEAPWLGGFEA